MAVSRTTAQGPDTQVIIVGAGPVGLMLAGELRLGGADVVVLERRPAPANESRASTLHARTMEILDNRGLLAALGNPPNERRGHFGGIPLDLSLPSPYPGQWKVPQFRTEEVLQEWAAGLGADVRRGWEVRELADDGDHVTVTASTPHGTARLTASYLAACDGEDSTVRALVGAEFPGHSTARELLRADVAGIDIPNRRFERLDGGLAIAARSPAGVTRVMVHEFGSRAAPRSEEPSFAEVIDVWKRVTGEDISGGEPVWVNAFGDACRQLAHYRHGRVLFAGDAAHQQLPVGGQALNLGLQDAVNLGWKLALRVRGAAPESLLDTYHSERHAAGARILGNIEAQALLLLGDTGVEPMRRLMSELIADESNRARLAGMISGLGVRYPDNGDHPLTGTRLPPLSLADPAGATTTTLLRSGRGLLLTAGEEQTARLRMLARPWSALVTVATVAESGSDWQDMDTVLVRPDGYIGWAGTTDRGRDGDPVAGLRRWFGEARQET